MENLHYWVGFNLVRGIGPVRLRALLERFGDLAVAWEAPAEELAAAGLDRRTLANLLQARRQIDLDQVWQKICAAGVQVLTWESPDYPALLLKIPDPPPVLFVKGTLLPADEWAVALVGTRKPTTYGREAARRLAGDLARRQVTVVSGLARGIDAVVHRTVLEAGGRTIAVLGCGVDVVYPPEHRTLAAQIVENGALISDYPLGTAPEAINFPPRNRIISGLSLGVVVVEAGEGSGALITASFAAEQGRDVFAVPGTIFNPVAAGCNRLLRDGAGVVTEVRDILESLHLDAAEERQAARQVFPANATEAAILERLTGEPCHVDELCRSISLPVATVTGALAILELKGMVRQVGRMQYVVIHEPESDYSTDAG